MGSICVGVCCAPVAIPSAVFCVICSLLMFIPTTQNKLRNNGNKMIHIVNLSAFPHLYAYYKHITCLR